MYSLNAPVPPAVARLALDLAQELPGATARARGEHTLLVKRLGAGTDVSADRLIAQAREALAGAAPFNAQITGVDCFEEPEAGTGPVVYLTVESPALDSLHRALCDVFEPVAHLEGEGYVPHVTIARGGDLEAARRLCARQIEPNEFLVDELVVWDARRDVAAARYSLPV